MASAREALIIATGTYEDPKLSRLRAPGQDAAALERVLGDPAIGHFHSVRKVIDQRKDRVEVAVNEFFASRGLSDFLLLHISGHGIKDDEGRLYFAARNTQVGLLPATAVSAHLIKQLMDDSRARAIVLLLDCCFAGAFISGSKGDRTVHLRDEFEGGGRAVLTASRDIEYAWEGDKLVRMGKDEPSVFTKAIVEGLEGGQADRDGDGRVSVQDLYDHVFEKVREAGHRQTPQLSVANIEKGLHIALNPHPPAALPEKVRRAIEDPLPGVRAAVVVDLVSLLNSNHPDVQLASRQALERLRRDDSGIVSAAAERALNIGRLRRLLDRLQRHSGVALVVAAGFIGLAIIAAAIIALMRLAPMPFPQPPAPVRSASETAAPTPAVVSRLVKVPASEPWTDTGIDLTAGQQVTIEVTGEVRHNATDTVGPDGDPRLSYQQFGILTDVPHAAAIGKIGEQGQPFRVGRSYRATVDRSGRLYLCVNDRGLDNNLGAFEARIEVTPPR